MSDGPNIYMTVPQYAEHRQCCEATVWAWVKRGLPSVKQGKGRRILRAEADAWIDGGSLPAAKARKPYAKRA